MKIKSVNNLLNVLITIVIIVAGIYTYKFLNTFSAPEYEIVNLDITYPYEFTTADGQKITSHYVPAYHNGKPVAYDPIYKKSTNFTEAYINEISQKMPPSKYGFFTRHSVWWIWGGTGIVVIIVWLSGIVIKEFLLAVYVYFTKRFADSAYFFKEDRWAGNKIARKVFTETIGNYITNKTRSIMQQYEADSANLLIGMLQYVKKIQSPRIPYALVLTNNTTSQSKFISQRIAYWEKLLDTNSEAEENIKYLRNERNKDYVDFKIFTTEKDVYINVSIELNELFEKLMGERIFTFEWQQATLSRTKIKKLAALMVKIDIYNSERTFTWSGDEYRGQLFPGINIKFTILARTTANGENVLWKKSLNPVCNYTAETLVVSDLYDNMIRQTIGTFSKEIK
ncbi:MAG: hypothetical protein IJV19_07345 [Prevotella sp.]|nr:hypothetical protein [Prevotella sp.]